MYIPRAIEPRLQEHLFQGKIITLYGARRVGKTTLVKKILESRPDKSSTYLNCDEGDTNFKLTRADTSTSLRSITGNTDIVVIDEAQRIKDIGLKLKLLVDNYPNQQIIATGSSAFELSNEISEPLTGRTYEFWLYPFSLDELRNVKTETLINRELENLMIYGSYPEVIEKIALDDKKTTINGIADSYLYKDILKFNNIKSSGIVQNLLRALALQIGNEVSYTELSSLVGVSKETIASYVELLEKVFVIFRLNPLSRNLRKEIGKTRKVYFYDLGIRNALINNFNSLAIRNDVGALWENLMVCEVKKKENFIGSKKNLFFWRTYDQQEIDLVEEEGGAFRAYEFKWNKIKSKKPPKAWRENYKNATWRIINKENFLDFYHDE